MQKCTSKIWKVYDILLFLYKNKCDIFITYLERYCWLIYNFVIIHIVINRKIANKIASNNINLTI